MIEIVKLTSKDAIYYWDTITPLLLKGLKRTDGEYSIKDYKEYIENEYCDLWIAVNLDDKNIEAIAVTEIVKHPNFNEFLIRLISGTNIDLWLSKENQQLTFIKQAKENNCKRLVMYGRKGWLRVLNKLNWKEGYTIMTKNIENGE
tara:strand:+ start:551 stop:988 length:438 start_codon:yes stop_codon:yes gene_type:complete